MRLSRIPKTEAASLLLDIPDGRISNKTATKSPTDFGSMELYDFLMSISLPAITVFAAWLLKNRKRGQIREDIYIEHEDGRIERRTFHIEISEDTTQAELIKRLSEITGTSEDNEDV